MPCLTPYRDDSAQLLLFKIASCLEASGGGAGVTSFNGFTGAVLGVSSFNGQTGAVILSLADVAAVADGRYVLKAGDTMTGALVHPDGTAALPSITFTGDLDTGMYHPAANTLAFSTDGVEKVRIASSGAVTTGVTTAVSFLTVLGLNSTFSLGQSGLARFGFASGTISLLFQSNATMPMGIGTFGGTSVILGTNNLERVRIDGATGHISFGIDSTYDIGIVGSRPQTIRVGNTVEIGMRLDLLAAAPISIASGANQRAGDVVLVAGTVTTANTTITANTRVFVSRKTAGGTPGTSFTYTLIAATSFTITSNNVLDTSTVSYLLIEVP